MSQFIELKSDMAFLVVDDGPTVREALVSILKTLGYKKFFQVFDGTSALEVLRREQIGFVICNRNLRQLSGMELLKEIRESPDLARVPFMMISSDIPKEDVMLASELGVDGYLKIPFVMKDVSTRISHCMARFQDVNNTEGIFEEAREAFLAGNYSVAIAAYSKLLEKLPGSARIRVGIARCYRGQENASEAERYLLEAIKVNEMYVHAHHELGLIFLQQERIDMALKYFDNAINLSPSNPIRYETISDILMRAGKFKEAEVYLMRAVKLELAYPILHSQLGKALFTQKKCALAAKFFEKALIQQPDNTSFLNSMGICMKELAKFDEAIGYYNQALKYRPTDTKILFNKALCLLQMSQFERSRKTLAQILKIEPTNEKAKLKTKDVDRLEAESLLSKGKKAG